MQHDYSQASAYVAALTGSVDTVMDWRALHDVDKSVPGYPIRGTLAQCWQQLVGYNLAGFGIFCIVNETDGQGRKLNNITRVRSHFADLDDVNTSAQAYNQAANMYPAPSFAVNTSPNKFHVYWPTGAAAYLDQPRFDTIQSKLVAAFNGDPDARDLARVLRVPGFYHCKIPSQPYLVTCHALPGYGYATPPEALEQTLSNVQARVGGAGSRHPLGDPALAAPTLELAVNALNDVDPNLLSRAEWIAKLSAFKQATFSITDPDTAYAYFIRWCERYTNNDPAENLKQWNSIRDTQLGWNSLKYDSPSAMLGTAVAPAYYSAVPAAGDPATPAPQPQRPVLASEILSAGEQQLYFQSCFYISKLDQIYDAHDGEFLTSGRFNVKYGGKLFLITSDAGGSKLSDEPWKAATRGTVFQVPKLYNIRFLPEEQPNALLEDEFGRKFINTYKPARIVSRRGDPSPFLRHMQLMIPNDADRKIYLDYIAHNIKFPGHKIPWAPVLISVEGIGKGILSDIIKHCVGKLYCYNANPKQMQESNNKYNGWQRNKLFIIADEIKVDDRRDLIEILKPMITDPEIVVEAKFENQGVEDNPANWQFHSNWKDAIPVSQNGRRYSIFYLAAQTNADLIRLGMNDDYFNQFRSWVYFGGGKEIIADYFLNYPIECGALPTRAPVTSSMPEAIELSRTPLEHLLHENVEAQQAGFRAGWVSLAAFKTQAATIGINTRNIQTLQKVLQDAGYTQIGKALRAYPCDGMSKLPPILYHTNPAAMVHQFARDQGYE